MNTYINYLWNYFLGRKSDFVRNSRSFITLPVPTSPGQTIPLSVSAAETIVDFADGIPHSFNLLTSTVTCQKGDKLYLIMNTSSGSRVVTSTGALFFNDCGPDSPPSVYTIEPEKVIIPFMFDGTNFYGLDYC